MAEAIVDTTLDIMPGETEFEHHKRLIRGKLIDKTLADYDYSELSEHIYGKKYAPDVARRLMYGSRYTLDLLDNETIANSSQSIQSGISSQIDELKRERQKFFDQRREHNKQIAKDARLEHLCDVLKQSADALTVTVGNIFENHTKDCDGYIDYDDIDHWFGVNDGAGCDCCRTAEEDSNEAILVFSDWHYGLTANNIFNTYNTDICRNRVATVVENAIQRIKLHRCKTLHVVVLGDLINGAIHITSRVASEELVCDQLMQASEILAQAIIRLSREVDETIVYMTYGNHGRTVQNKKESIHRDNMERLIPWWLCQRISAENNHSGKELNIQIAPDNGTEFIMLDVCGHSGCASHGDIDSIQSSPRLMTTLFSKQIGCDIDFVLLGDKHHAERYDELGVSSIMCGSLCGTDNYANDKRLFSRPSQLLLIVNKDIGIDAEYRIQCD